MLICNYHLLQGSTYEQGWHPDSMVHGEQVILLVKDFEIQCHRSLFGDVWCVTRLLKCLMFYILGCLIPVRVSCSCD